MSATHSLSGLEAEKSRSTRSGAGLDFAARFIVLPFRRRISVAEASNSRASWPRAVPCGPVPTSAYYLTCKIGHRIFRS